MTDKFTIFNMGLNGSFIKENGKIMDIERVVDLLNELSDENEQLKRSVQYWYDEHKRIVNNYVDKIKEVEKENEQLKQGLNDDLELIGQLQEENKQLKQHNSKLISKIDFLERVIAGDV